MTNVRSLRARRSSPFEVVLLVLCSRGRPIRPRRFGLRRWGRNRLRLGPRSSLRVLRRFVELELLRASYTAAPSGFSISRFASIRYPSLKLLKSSSKMFQNLSDDTAVVLLVLLRVFFVPCYVGLQL